MAIMHSKKVVVVGAGIAGLSCATSLCDKGYEVSVYEREEMAGGKAIGFLNSQTKLPEEHSVRACFKYVTLMTLLKRIPFGEKQTVFDRVAAVEVYYFANNRQYYKFPDMRRHGYFRQNLKALHILRKVFGLTLSDMGNILIEFLRYKFSASHRQYLSTVSFEEAIFSKLSDKGKLFMSDFSQFLVAGKSNAGAMTIYQDIFDAVGPGWSIPDGQTASYGMFDMPTSQALIDPWVEWLKKRGVQFHFNADVKLESVSGNTPKPYVNGAADSKTYLTADAFVFCLSLTDAKALNIRDNLPDENTLEWTNGVQFYLSRRPSSYPKDMVLCMFWTTPWHITLGVQDAELWPSIATKFKPGISCVVSATFTNANAPGVLYGKTVKECTQEELVKEMAAQCDLTDDLIMGHHIDDSLIRNSNNTGWIEKMSLFIATPDSLKQMTTDFKTNYDNLFLTGEFANTQKRTPSMEKAAQAGEGAAEAVDQALLQKINFC
jgi:uncharacterized protein with NAD-binding domain and iron-sulfur cluster